MENKNITHTARTCIILWNVGLFALVWCGFYNRFAFDTYRVSGGIISVLIYILIYYAFCQVYKAFRIASYQIGETIFSQIISFGISDLILYMECCLIYNRAVSLIPGLITATLQILGTAVLITGFKRYLMHHVPPRKTVFIYGNVSEEEVFTFRERIFEKYAHLFDVQETLSEKVETPFLQQKIAECHTVLFYEVSNERRELLGEYCLRSNKTVYFTPSLSDIVVRGCRPRHLLDTPLLKYEYVKKKKTEYGLKRGMDILLSFAVMIITSPIMLFTALAIKLEDRGPVFYKQERCTKDAKVFEILKFRSMIADAEKDGFIPCVDGDKRITKVGKFIRRTRIDELPQILNILKGDMSFVGPRPERVEHVEKYTNELPEFTYRMRVKGGLTGYAQIFGKYNTSAYDKLRLDLMYIENQSLMMDMKILMLTFKTIFKLESTEGFTEEKSKNITKEDASVAESNYTNSPKNCNDMQMKARI